MERYINLYEKDDLKNMELAHSCKENGENRIEQIKKFASDAGYKKIGIAYCISVAKYANQLEEYLNDEFDVTKIDCKLARIPSDKFVEGAQGTSCNPAGQAKVLEDAETELNISIGLCLGHDIIFSSKSKAPTTTLIVKDHMNKHNVIQAFSSM